MIFANFEVPEENSASIRRERNYHIRKEGVGAKRCDMMYVLHKTVLCSILGMTHSFQNSIVMMPKCIAR